MTKAGKVIVAGMTALCAAAAMAGETIAYRYDARGRLIKVVHAGSVNNNVSAQYSYDKADNRTRVNVVSSNPAPK